MTQQEPAVDFDRRALPARLLTQVRHYLTHADADPQQMRDFVLFANETNVRLAHILAIAVSLSALVFWPVDALLYGDRSQVLLGFTVWRSGLLGVCVLTLLCFRLSASCRRHATMATLALLIGGSAVVGLGMGLTHDMTGSWYYSCYALPFISILVLAPFTHRALATVTMTAAWQAGFFAVAQISANAATLFPIISFEIFAVTGSVVIGQVIYHLSFKNFLQKRSLAQRAEQLEDLDRHKSEFFSNVSHELRTPLTLILGSLRRLSRQSLSEDDQSLVAAGLRNSSQLLVLINDLLELARYESGHARLNKSVVDLARLIRHTVHGFSETQVNRHIELIGVDEIVAAEVDPHLVKALLYNLVSNAIKFTSADGGKIQIRLQVQGTELLLEVIDNGIGIAPEHLGSIFDRFTQADGSDRRRYTGTGIGLALVKKIVEHHGGDVAVRSQQGFGSTFCVKIPRGDIDGKPLRPLEQFDADRDHTLQGAIAATPTNPGNSPAPVPVDTDAAQILVVEDNDDLRHYVAGLMRQHYRVLEASDGAQGLKLAKQHQPDLVLSDLRMPEMSGHDLMAALRDDPDLAGIPVVLLTARSGVSTRIDALRAGAYDFLTKPFHEEELFARVDNLLKARTQERELASLNDELTELNARMASRLEEQLVELIRSGELRRFLPTRVAERILEGQLNSQRHFSRHKITVLFVDLTGYTELSSRHEPEEMAEILNAFLAKMTEIIVAHGGVVDKFIGDAVMAFFAPPERRGVTQIESALCAALTMQQSIGRLSREWQRKGFPADLKIRIGVHCGFATVGVFGSEQMATYTAVGTPVNLAARIQSEAEPGQIWCSEETLAPVRESFAHRAIGPLSLKGILREVEAFQILARKNHHST